LAKPFREERGMALVMALGIMMVLSITATTSIYYATSNQTSSSQHSARGSAYDLAEAGLAAAMAKLYGEVNTDGSSKHFASDGTTPLVRSQQLFPSPTVLSYPTLSGTATYSGSLNTAVDPMIWTITSVGAVIKSGKTLTRTLTKTAYVRGTNDGDNSTAWSRFYADKPNQCLTIEKVNFVNSVSARGGICLTEGGTITGAATSVNVGPPGVTITGPNASLARDPSVGSGWTNSGNAFTNNSVYATSILNSGVTSAPLLMTGFGFTAIPASAIIRGISVTVDRKASTTSAIQDLDVNLMKASVAVGSDKAVTGSYWLDTDGSRTYGSASDLWGTTWTAADINNAGFGLRFVAKNFNASQRTAYVDDVNVTVTYTIDVPGIGTVGTPVKETNIEGNCKYNAQTAHAACDSVDKIYSAKPTKVGDDLTMPAVDFTYWWNNAKPGPKHFCTNPSPGLAANFFDNDAGSTTSENNSVTGNGEMTPEGVDYTCKVVENGVTVGELSWNHTTRVLTINGSIYVDGNFRFDDDGKVTHYQGRGVIYASGYTEFDEIVCSGGSGTGNCLSTMSTWSPSLNLLVLLSKLSSEYDQGGTSCTPSIPLCPSGHTAGAFQGVVYSLGNCYIHQGFLSSGPVVCNTIQLDDNGEPGVYPTYYTFPALTDLVDGQKYSTTSTADNFELSTGSQSG
jgi:Tfp pilus assembly protein PilX